ncbi:hypothetical protein FRC06_000899, partial [Ceratobasidium sp. 370]
MLVTGEAEGTAHMLQMPDLAYEEFWQWYVMCQDAEHGVRIPQFTTDPLNGPIPLNVNKWACNCIRLEQGILPHANDPHEGSLLTAESVQHECKARKAAKIPCCDYVTCWFVGDDNENGESDMSASTTDAGSVREENPDEDDAMGEPDDGVPDEQEDVIMDRGNDDTL